MFACPATRNRSLIIFRMNCARSNGSPKITQYQIFKKNIDVGKCARDARTVNTYGRTNGIAAHIKMHGAPFSVVWNENDLYIWLISKSLSAFNGSHGNAETPNMMNISRIMILHTHDVFYSLFGANKTRLAYECSEYVCVCGIIFVNPLAAQQRNVKVSNKRKEEKFA